eukprot:348782_1
MLSLKSVDASMKIDVSNKDIISILSPSKVQSHSTCTESFHVLNDSICFRTQNHYSLHNAFNRRGYMPLKPIANTLQGSVWIVTKTNNKDEDRTSIIKVTDRSLHAQNRANINGISIQIYENIIREATTLKYLNSAPGAPMGLIQYHDFFIDSRNLFLVMENGGSSLFDFVKRCHELIKHRLIDIHEWHLFCKRAMYQMVHVLEWMHCSMDCCHLDLSLENFTIKHVECTIMMSETGKKMIFASDFQMKLVDFGLAEVFTAKCADGTTDFTCTKYAGKTQYKAPEVSEKVPFDARKADCWSLGVCFFMMFIGNGPFHKACDEDLLFVLIMNGRLYHVFENWKVLDYVSTPIVNLLRRLFRAERYRLTMTQIKQHIWLKS